MALRLAIFGGKGIRSLGKAWKAQKRAIAEWIVTFDSDREDGIPSGI